MISSIALVLAQAGSYGSILVYETPKGKAGWDRGYATATVLNENEAVAGYACETVGNHGEAMFAKPFVWQSGTFRWLPLGKAEYGRVFAGNENTLVGEILIDYKTLPAKWTADPKVGWAKPTLTQLGSEGGYAIAISETGTIWIKHAEHITCLGASTTRIKLEKFDIVGVDAKDRAWGNQYSSLGFASTRNGESAAYLEEGKLNALPYKVKARAVNSKGVLCGVEVDTAVQSSWGPTERGPVIVADGKIISILLPKNRFSDVRDINDSRQVVGSFNVAESKPKKGESEFHSVGFIYANGGIKLLSPPASDASDFSPLRINDRGTMVGVSTVQSRYRIYLRRPR
ncbi:MAG: hypothetical protein ABL949_01230 [Fimbriimonadaceae bacterium]